MIRYTGNPPSEDGHYLVREDGKLTVAEYESGTWHQLCADYDMWEYSSATYTIEIVCRLDLEKIAAATQGLE